MSLEESNDIAIVGMAGRFPGAANVAEFWRNLEAGVESIRFFTDEELIAAGVDPALVNDPKYVKASPVIDGYDEFDAGFFGYSPREAAVMDPQHRLLLESAVAALDDAGHDPGRFDGRVGVFAGSAMNTYFIDRLGRRFREEYLPTLIGNDKDFLATRVSYRLNLTGPSLTVQTACSTSLVALHLACQSLLSEECDMALAGGVSIRIPQHVGYLHEEQSVYTPDGHCRPFDEKAGGTIFGSGVGVVVMRRVADAVADGDHIYAVVKGSALNNDGSTKADYTAPSVASQSEVIAEALAVADVDPATISYVEAHGTGTFLGDPIEVEALTKAFRASTDKTQFCALGSVKGNVGHLDAAAGVTGVIKTALALAKGVLPPSINYSAPNPQIEFAETPFFVNTEVREWPGPRRAGVTSLGIGGTNAHAVLEEAPAPLAKDPARACHVLTLSARSEAALEAATDELADHLEGVELADVAFTTQCRMRHDHRRAVIASNTAEAVKALRERSANRCLTLHEERRRRPVAFVFPGNGTQYPQMGAGLYRSESVYGAAFDECLAILTRQHDLDLAPHVFTDDGAELDRPSLAQPAIFACGYAAARMWMAWGVEPVALIGHSLGEYTAMCLAGVLSLEDALALVVTRGRMMERIEKGTMLAVPLDEDELRAHLGPDDSIAAINAPGLCVASGRIAAMETLHGRLTGAGVDAKLLPIQFAAHSCLIDPVLDEFGALARSLALHKPEVPVISCVSGTWLTDEQALDPGYWVTHLRDPVRFADGIGKLLEEPDRVLLETGPGRTLVTLAKMQPGRQMSQAFINTIRHPKRAGDDNVKLHRSMGELWLAGVQPDWESYHDGARRRVSLPTYPFQRQRHWVDEETGRHGVRSKAYLPVWSRTPPVAPGSGTERWLLLGDSDEVAAALTAQGHEVVVEGDADRIVDLRAGSFDDLLETARGIALRGETVHLDIVTRGTFDVTGAEPLDPNQALLLGPARVLPREAPGVTTRVIDVAPDVDADRLVAELVGRTDEAEVALRGPHRWTQSMQPLVLDDRAPPVREGGVYLVTGGLSGIGSRIASDLAERFGAKLVLVSRSAQEADGDDVLVLRGDVSDAKRMRKVVAAAKKRFGALHGVIHAAGALGESIIAAHEPKASSAILAPKVEGTIALCDALRDEELDFVLLVSSVSSVLGPAGSVDYTAANAFLDAFAAANTRDHGVPTLAVSWPVWADTGMARTFDAHPELKRIGITADEGVALTYRLLACGAPHVVVASDDLDRVDLSVRAADPTRPELSVAFEAPEGDAEERVAEIWGELLGVSPIGRHDRFTDLGGHSLLATRVIGRIAAAFEIQLTLRDFMNAPTVQQLAAVIEEIILREIEAMPD